MDDASLEWSPLAIESMDLVIKHIGQHNLDAAIDLHAEVRKCLRRTLRFPQMYRASARMEGVREIVVTANYIVPYRFNESKVEVLDVVHARRNWPNPPCVVS